MAQRHRQHPLPRYSEKHPPLAWRCWLRILGASSDLTERLWHCFRRRASYADLSAIYRFSARQDPAGAGELLRLVSPQRLLTLCAEVAPEGTTTRRKDVQRLENTIVERAKGPDRWQ